MNANHESRCKDSFSAQKFSEDQYDAFRAGYEAGMKDIDVILTDDVIRQFMAISNVYALTHAEKWSMKELCEYIKTNWNKVKK